MGFWEISKVKKEPLGPRLLTSILITFLYIKIPYSFFSISIQQTKNNCKIRVNILNFWTF